MGKFLVRIKYEAGPLHDLYVIPPEGMDKDGAIRAVDAAIVVAKAAGPGTFDFHELMTILRRCGFVFPDIVTSNEEW